MKKFKVYFLASLCLLVGFIFTACGEPKISFKDQQILVNVGEVVDPENYLNLEGAEIEDVIFSSSNQEIVYITPDNMLAGRNVGTCVVSAKVGSAITQVSVKVEGEKYTLSTPLGLNYNNGKLTWQEVIENVNGSLYVCDNYEVTLTSQDGSKIVENVVTNSYTLTNSGTYTAAVKAIGGDGFNPSQASESITFSCVFEVQDLTFDKDSSMLSWKDGKNSSNTIYKIIKNGVYLENQIVKGDKEEFSFELDLQGGETLSVQVVAEVNDFQAKSDILKLSMLDSVSIEVENGQITWNSIVGAESYEVFVESVSTSVTTSVVTQQTNYSIEGKTPGEYRVYVKALSSENFTFESENSNVLTVTKLPVADVVFNYDTNMFSVINSAGHETVIVLKNSRTLQEEQISASSYTFDKADSDTYVVSAYFKAQSNNEINGDMASEYKITRLGTTALSHNFDNGVSFISFDSILNAQYFVVYKKLNDGVYGELGNFVASGNGEERLNLGSNIFNEAGIYTIKVEAKNNGSSKEIFLTSEMTYEIERLDNVQNIQVADNVISWDAIENATAYEYYFQVYGTDKIATDVKTTTAQSIQIPNTLGYGEYCFKVKALGNNSSYIDSLNYAESSKITIYENLLAPTLEFNRENLVITLTPQDSIANTTYELKFYNTDNILQFTESVVVDGKIEKNVSEYLSKAGNYRVTAQALNSNPLVSNSLIYEIAIEKLFAPEKIKVQGGVVSFADADFNGNTAVLGQDPTIIKINGIESEVLSAEQSEFVIEVCYQSEEYRIVEGVKTYFLNSDFTTFRVERLSVPSNLEYDFVDKKIVWDAVENADFYNVYINNLLENNTENNYYDFASNEAFVVKVSACKEDISLLGSVSTGEVGYVTSYTSNEINILKADNVTNLKLDTQTLSLTWNAVTNVDEANYKIYVDDEEVGETTETTYVLKSDFSVAKIYNITVVATGSSFLNGNGTSITLQKLSFPTTLIKEAGKDVYHLSLIEGAVSFSVNGEIEESINLEDLTANDGEVIKAVKFNAKPSSEVTDGKYYLNSEESEFRFARLSTPTGLAFNDNVLTWDEIVEAKYKVEITSQLGTKTLESETSSLSINENEGFTFKVQAESINDISQADVENVTYLSSLQSAGFEVVKENSIENLTLEVENDKVKINFNWQSKLENTPNFEIYLDGALEPNQPNLSSNSYSYTFSQTFEEVKVYKISVKVVGSSFIASNENSVFVERLKAPQTANITDGIFTVNKNITAEIKGVSINNSLVESLDLNTLEQNTDFEITVKYVAKECSEITDGHYYLNSAESIFKVYKFFTPNMVSVVNGNLSWNELAQAQSYTLKITNTQGEEFLIENLTQATLSLQDERLLAFIDEIGNYDVEVKYVAKDVEDLSTYDKANNTPVANISSNYSEPYILTKLDIVQNVTLSTSAEPEQREVTISWNSVLGASNYTIYLNNVVYSTVETTSVSFINEVSASGDYTVSIRANSNDKISSELQSISFTRLASISEASIDANAYMTWTKLNNNPYYVVMYVDSTNEIFYEGQENNNYKDFSQNENLKSYIGGIVNFKVLVKGDGQKTLSSAYFNLTATKLTAPNLVVNASSLYIEEQGIAPENSYKFNLKIDMPTSSIEIAYNNYATIQTFTYPTIWTAGEYTFTAKAVSEVINVISSNEVSVIKTRLDTISNHIFKREVLTEEEKASYTSDDIVNFVSDRTYIEFSPAENVSSYNLAVAGTSFTTSLAFENSRIDIQGGLDLALTGSFTIVVTSLATDDGSYINSAPYYITGRRLSSLSAEDFITRDGKVTWVDNQTSVSTYLIKISEIEGTEWGYWQGLDGGTRIANLNGLDSGIKAYNIKAIGNITENGVSSNVILDSNYLTQPKQFNKLEKPQITVYSGFLACNVIEGASSYYALVDGTSYYLSDYSYISQVENQFIGYNENMANLLQANTQYEVQIQARGTSSEIYSDYSDKIFIRFLQNVNTNTNDVKLVLDPSGDLTKTKLSFKLAENSSGVAISFRDAENYGFVIYNYLPTQNNGYYQIDRTDLHEYLENTFIKVSSVGSSSLQSGNFYYLNSAFSQEFNLKMLSEPTNLRVENGMLTWDNVEGASGYYVYINKNLYYVNSEYEMYTSTSLALPETYGSLTNNKTYNFGVVAVSSTTDYISSHWFGGGEEDKKEGSSYFIENVVLPHAPNEIDLIDGGIVWNDGLSGLDEVNIDIISLALNLNKILNAPIVLLYNTSSDPLAPNIQFEIPSIELRFTDVLSGKNYDILLESQIIDNADGSITLNLEYLNLIKVSQSQIEKLSQLKSVIVQTGFITEDSRMVKVLNELINIFTERLDKTVGWPNINTTFEELKGTYNIPAGRYYLKIRQVGSSTFLSSNYNAEKEVYIPEAPFNATIEAPETTEGEKQFYLSWDNVTINSSIEYQAQEKYLVVAENISGERRIIARVNETSESSAGNNRTRINLTTLVNDGTLTPEDVKLFVVVAGDSNKTLMGKKSTVLNIEVLPEVTPFMDEGYLSWNTLPSCYGVQIIAIDEAHVINETIPLSLSMRRWSGDNMTPNNLYSVSIRAVGEVYVSAENGVKTFIISGKKVEFSLHKLNAPNVSVSTQGIFNWSAVSGNVSGYIVDINGDETSLTSSTLSYESSVAGFNLYQFRTKGDTCMIETTNENGEQVNNTYYINSLPNKQEGKDYYGIYGVMLPEVEDIFLEEGNLKWKTIDLSFYNLNAIADQENYKQNIIYKLIIGENVYFIEQEKYQDVNAQYVTFGEFENLPSGEYSMSLQAFIYWQPKDSSGSTSLPDIIASFTNNLDGKSDYFALLGVKKTTEDGNITKARAITADENISSGLAVENGEIVWDYVKELNADGGVSYTHLSYILTFATDENFTQNVLTVKADFDGLELYAKWWDEVLADGLEYYVKVKVNGKDSFLNSSDSVYADSSSSPIVLRKVSTLRLNSMLMGEGIYPYGDEDYGNFIKIELNSSMLKALSSNFNFGFILRYRDVGADNLTPWNYFDFGKLNYENGGENTSVYTLDISKLGGVSSFEYQVQLVLLDGDNVKWLKSNWSNKDNFNTPDSVEVILLDTERQEFYWKDDLIPESSTYYGYIVLDELLDQDNNVIKSYKFTIPSGSHVGQDYSALIRGERYVYYAPFEMGNHRISVRKTPDNQGALVSAETFYKENEETYTVYNFNLFDVNVLSTADHGTSQNPYLISNEEDFVNIKLRANKYTYMTSYVNKDNQVVSTEQTYSFVQTADIEITQTITGYLVNSFKNVYDGAGYKLTYNLVNSGSNASLINTISESGIVKNLRLDVTLRPTNSTITFASVALNNSGKVSNSVLENVSIASNSASINYAGFVYNNSGRLERLVSKASFTAGNVTNAGAIVYSNSRSVATVYQCGNIGNITLNGVNLSQKLGGIAISNSGTIDECYNKGTLTLNSNVTEIQMGGIVAQNSTNSTIINTYNTGKIVLEGNHTNVSFGGIVGYSANNNIVNSYSVQVITSPVGGISDTMSYGAIVGRLSSSISERNNYYAQGSTSGIGNYVSTTFAKSVSVSEMKNDNFVVTINGGDTAFMKDSYNNKQINNGYPIFVWETSEDLLYNKLV